MKTINKVILLGNATRDSDLQELPSGRNVATFGMATNRIWNDADGNTQREAEFHAVVAWGELAEFCAEHVRKGKPLYVGGYLHTRSWETDAGPKQYRTEVVAENLVLVGHNQPEPHA